VQVFLQPDLLMKLQTSLWCMSDFSNDLVSLKEEFGQRFDVFRKNLNFSLAEEKKDVYLGWPVGE